MGRPRKYKRQEIRKKCMHCGKFTNFPYIHTSMIDDPDKYDTYSRKSEKVARTRVKGAVVSYTCNTDCFDEYRATI